MKRNSLLKVGLIFIIVFGLINLGLARKNNIEVKRSQAIERPEPKIIQPKEDIRTMTILAAGDSMFHMPQVRSAYRDGVYNFDENFKYVEEYINRADLALVNFETVAAGREEGFSGYPRFNSPEESLEALKNAGFDIINTANNHILDRGRPGLLRTIDHIEGLGLKNLGTSRDGVKKILIEEIDGIRLGFLSYSYGFNGNEAGLSQQERLKHLSIIDEDRIRDDLEAMKGEDLDFKLVFIHWGDEYSQGPNNQQRELADKIFAWGADIILGSHPHVVHTDQLLKVDDRDKYVIYSLGNFISNQRKESMGDSRTEDGLMLSLELEKDFVSGKSSIKSIDYIPTFVNKYYKGRNIYNILPVKDVIEGRIVPENYDSIKTRLEASYKRTMDTLENK